MLAPASECELIMQPDDSIHVGRDGRWQDFRRRADHAAQGIYRHRTRGWEYIPVHPFADEPELLERLQMRPQDCLIADAWWSIDGDATLLECGTPELLGRRPGLFAKWRGGDLAWVYLVAVLETPAVTRVAFEQAMSSFAEAGFPRDPKFRLREADPWLRIEPPGA